MASSPEVLQRRRDAASVHQSGGTDDSKTSLVDLFHPIFVNVRLTKLDQRFPFIFFFFFM